MRGNDLDHYLGTDGLDTSYIASHPARKARCHYLGFSDSLDLPKYLHVVKFL